MLLFLYESRRRISIISSRIKKGKKKKGKRKTIEFFIFFNLSFYFFFFYGILDISKAPMKNKYRVNMKNVWKKKGKSFIIHFFSFFIRKGNRKSRTLINDFSSNIEIIYMETRVAQNSWQNSRESKDIRDILVTNIMLLSNEASRLQEIIFQGISLRVWEEDGEQWQL